jgi:hypothetical protein
MSEGFQRLLSPRSDLTVISIKLKQVKVNKNCKLYEKCREFEIISCSQMCSQQLKRKRYPCYKPWRPLGLLEVEAPTLLRQPGSRWRQNCQPYAPAALYPQVSIFLRFLILISVRGWVEPRAIVRPEGLGKLEKSTSWGRKPLDLPVCSLMP